MVQRDYPRVFVKVHKCSEVRKTTKCGSKNVKKNNIEKSHQNILNHYVIFKVSLIYNENDAESKKLIDNGHGL